MVDTSDETLKKLVEIFNVLELDRKARVELMLLYHSGLPGRTSANKVLWNLLSDWALDPTYEDLSHKVSSEVPKIRRTFDRPPWNHRDLAMWPWRNYAEPLHRNWKWIAKAVPPRAFHDPPLVLVVGPGGPPLEPAECWGTWV